MKWIFYELILLLLNILVFVFNWKAQSYGLACMSMFCIGLISGLIILMIKDRLF